MYGTVRNGVYSLFGKKAVPGQDDYNGELSQKR
jgi:hypothetical protein